MSAPEHPAIRAWREACNAVPWEYAPFIKAGDALAAALEAAEAALRSIDAKPRPSGAWCKAVARAYWEGRLPKRFTDWAAATPTPEQIARDALERP